LDDCGGDEGDEVLSADEEHGVDSETKSPFMEEEDLPLVRTMGDRE